MKFSIPRYVAAWLIHAFTASGAVFGLYALYAIYLHDLVLAFWLIVVTIIIDAVDGYFARLIKIKDVLPNTDGALLDNVVDYFNYVILSAYFLLAVPFILPKGWHTICVIVMVLSASYQFTQRDAKTADHFFKRFPSYWNIVVFYLFFWNMPAWANVLVIFVLALLSFVPIKYVYPSRLDYLTVSVFWRWAMRLATLLWGVATIGLLWIYPKTNTGFVILSVGYVLLYVVVSLYRTYRPLPVRTQ
jgi:phosphatidylcholine synthase